MTDSSLVIQTPTPAGEVEARYPHIQLGKLGMWAFLISDAVTFATLLVSSHLLQVWSQDWPVPAEVLNLPVVGIMTGLLLASSGTLALSLAAIKQGQQSRFRTCLLLTLIGGSSFLLLQTWEWSHLIRQGFTLVHNPWGAQLFGASFYILTGFHGCHVIAGLVYLAVILLQGLRGRYHHQNTGPVLIAALYWYFVDVSWLFVLLVVYLP